MAMDQSLPKKIAVLMGGPGSERDVSLATGAWRFESACARLGAEVVEVDVRDENFALPNDVDLAFITIHGTFGEDGQVQKILEDRGVPYTGDGVEGEPSWLSTKFCRKKNFSEHDVSHSGMGSDRSRPASNNVGSPGGKAGATGLDRWRRDCERRKRARFGDGGSRQVRSQIVDRKICSGRELTIGILGDQALPILEIIPKGGFYDFNNKYPFLNPQAGGARRACLPGENRSGQDERNSGAGAAAFRALGLVVYGRVDVLLSRYGRTVCARSKHDSRNDGGELAARSGCGCRNQLCRSLPAHHRAFSARTERSRQMRRADSARPRNQRVSNVRQRRQQHLLDVKVRSRKATQHRNRGSLSVLSRVVAARRIVRRDLCRGA